MQDLPMCGGLTLPSVYGASSVCTARVGRLYLGLISGSFPKVAGKYGDEGGITDWQLVSRKRNSEILFYKDDSGCIRKEMDYSNSGVFFGC